MRRLISYNVFEGDPNLIAEGQILVIRDSNVEGKISDIQQRVNSKLVSMLTCKESKVLFAIGASPEDATITINGQNTNMVYVSPGDKVSYSVEKTGYFPQSADDVVVSADTIKTIVLQIRQS